MKLKLYRPLKQLLICQNFGENNACVKPDGTGIIARTGPTCPTGYISIYKYFGMRGHNGLDFPAQDWENVFASVEGTVAVVSTNREMGLGLDIITDNKYEVRDTTTGNSGEHQVKVRYWHLAGTNVKKGDKVKVGQIIGWADNTGYSTGTHLHFDVKAVGMLDDGYFNIWQDNGYIGAIDPLPYLQDLSAYEKQTFLNKIKTQLADILSQAQDLLTK